jgi:putative salt-induced outer membrane protein YdiY
MLIRLTILTAIAAITLFTPATAAALQDAAPGDTTAAAEAAPTQDEPVAETDAAPEAAAAAAEDEMQAAPPGVTEAVYAASCEAGFSLAEGNSSNRTLAAGCNASRQGEVWLIGFTGKTRFGQSRYGGPDFPGGPEHARGDFILSENNWAAALREERSLTADKTQYIFLIEGASGDQFKGFWTRYDAQAGYGYAFVNSETAVLKSEIGGQFNRDYLVAPNADGDKQENRWGGVLTLIGEKKLNEAVLLAAKASYMPNLEEPDSDYRALGEASITARLSDRLSFKSAAQLLYDSEPPLVKPIDKAGAAIAAAPDVPAHKSDVTWNNLLVVTIF